MNIPVRALPAVLSCHRGEPYAQDAYLQCTTYACQTYGVDVAQVLGGNRTPTVCRARAMAISLCREVEGADYDQLAAFFDVSVSCVQVSLRRRRMERA